MSKMVVLTKLDRNDNKCRLAIPVDSVCEFNSTGNPDICWIKYEAFDGNIRAAKVEASMSELMSYFGAENLPRDEEWKDE